MKKYLVLKKYSDSNFSEEIKDVTGFTSSKVVKAVRAMENMFNKNIFYIEKIEKLD